MESIAIGERPGTWHTRPEQGPQHIDWNPNAVVPESPVSVPMNSALMLLSGCWSS